MYYSTEGKQGRTIIARLKPGQELVAGITKVIQDYNIKAGYIPVLLTGLKSLHVNSMKPSDNGDNPEDIILEYREPLECFGQGTIAEVDGKPSIHIHFNAARTDTTMIGGHLISGIVVYVTEVVIVEVVGVTMTRKKDSKVFNLPLLTFEK